MITQDIKFPDDWFDSLRYDDQVNLMLSAIQLANAYTSFFRERYSMQLEEQQDKALLNLNKEVLARVNSGEEILSDSEEFLRVSVNPELLEALYKLANTVPMYCDYLADKYPGNLLKYFVRVAAEIATVFNTNPPFSFDLNLN